METAKADICRSKDNYEIWLLRLSRYSKFRVRPTDWNGSSGLGKERSFSIGLRTYSRIPASPRQPGSGCRCRIVGRQTGRETETGLGGGSSRLEGEAGTSATWRYLEA